MLLWGEKLLAGFGGIWRLGGVCDSEQCFQGRHDVGTDLERGPENGRACA